VYRSDGAPPATPYARATCATPLTSRTALGDPIPPQPACSAAVRPLAAAASMALPCAGVRRRAARLAAICAALAVLAQLPAVGASVVAPPDVTPALLKCVTDGDVLQSNGVAAGQILAAVVAPSTDTRVAQHSATQTCVWVVGSLGASTKLFGLRADGDATSSAFFLFGARWRSPRAGARACSCGHSPKTAFPGARADGEPTVVNGTVDTDPATLMLRLQGCAPGGLELYP